MGLAGWFFIRRSASSCTDLITSLFSSSSIASSCWRDTQLTPSQKTKDREHFAGGGRVQQHTHSVVLPFLRDAAVAVAPVEGHLLLLLLVQPDELLSRLRHKVVQAVQVALTLTRGALKRGKASVDGNIINTTCDCRELSYQ